MGKVKQTLLVKSTTTKQEIKYELESYKFDLNNKAVKENLLKILSKTYKIPFDMVYELKNND